MQITTEQLWKRTQKVNKLANYIKRPKVAHNNRIIRSGTQNDHTVPAITPLIQELRRSKYDYKFMSSSGVFNNVNRQKSSGKVSGIQILFLLFRV